MNKKLRSFNSPTFLAYALIAPAAIYILLIVAWPVVETIRLSFTNSSLAGEDYVGFENYEKMLSSKKFNKIVTRTFVWMFFSVSLKLIVGLIGAILLNANLRGRSIFRVLIMPPWVVPIASAGKARAHCVPPLAGGATSRASASPRCPSTAGRGATGTSRNRR